MPTGYTADLEKRGYDIKSWLKESVIRAMGVCVTLRDNGTMSVQEILASLKEEEGDSYHSKKLKEAQAALVEFKKLDADALQALYTKEKSAAQIDFDRRKIEYDLKKAQHLEALDKTAALLGRAINEKQSEVTVGTLKFAVEQLKRAYEFDYGSGPYVADILKQSFDEWNIEKRRKLLWDIEYHGKELPAEERRNFDRFNSYKKFVEWVDSATVDAP
jgi:hypothetical protein